MKDRGSRFEPVLTVVMIFHGFDRFFILVNISNEPDRTHGQFAVEPVEPAGPVRVWKHLVLAKLAEEHRAQTI